MTLGRDFGTELEVVDGLSGEEKVVANPGERLVEGIDVQVIERKEPAASQPSGGSK